MKQKPFKYIKYVLEQMDLRQVDLVVAGCGSRSHVSEIVRGKRKPTIKFIRNFLKVTHRKEMAYYLIDLMYSL